MPGEKRRRSRSRSRRKAAKPRGGSSEASSPPAKQRAAAKGDKRRGEKEKKVERKEEVRKAPPQKQAVAAAAAASDDEAEDEDDESGDGKFAWEDEEDGNGAGASAGDLEARAALLEVENAALRAENAELKRRLVEALRRGPAPSRKALLAGKPGQAPPSAPAPAAPAPAQPEDPRRARLAAAAAEPPSERAQARLRHREEGGAPKKADEPEQDDEEDDPMKRNAVLLANDAMEAYNESVPNNIPYEKRNPLVEEKLERFLGCFGDKVQILDLKSGGAVIRDLKTFKMRYNCVFRESGAKLKGTVHKRFYFDARGKKPTYCLDFEVHESLVTATAGTPPDGKLGVRPPRTEHLAVLYEELGGKITRMWLRPDTEKLGLDPTAGEDVLVRTDAYKAFAAKIAECKGGSAGEFIFNNYHDTPTVG